MAQKLYGTYKPKVNKGKIWAIVFGCIILVLISFIIWATVMFSNGGGGVFMSQASEITALKLEILQKDAEITRLNGEVTRLTAIVGDMPTDPISTDKPSPTPTATATSKPRPTKVPAVRPSTKPVNTPTPDSGADSVPESTQTPQSNSETEEQSAE